MNLSPENVSTKRTTVNIVVVGYIVYALNRVLDWMGLEVEVKLTDADMLIVIPILGVLFGIGYRLSRAVSTRWPRVGWVLFGSKQEPAGLKPIGEAP